MWCLASEARTPARSQGLTRSLVANMVTGVSQGFERVLEINGIGYRAELKGSLLVFHLGFSSPKEFELPDRGQRRDREEHRHQALLRSTRKSSGRTAASIRRMKPPEPYKGKGIKYAEERIQKKAGKTGTK